MKYKIGDQVKYDSGEWRFYGTISAAIENSISPCYRIVVERMEKLNCGFSSMQFEFELEAHSRQTDSSRNTVDENENTEPAAIKNPITESENSAPIQIVAAADSPSEISNTWLRNMDAYVRGENNRIIRAWARDNTINYRIGKLKKEKLDKLMAINFPFDAIKSKVHPYVSMQEQMENKPDTVAVTSWDVNLQAYADGVRSGKVEDWAYRTRKRYNNGTLPQSMIEKLKEIDFVFDLGTKKTEPEPKKPEQAVREPDTTGTGGTPITSIWEQNLEAYVNGERAGKVDDWARRNRKNYEMGKLSDEKLERLIEINFPFSNIVQKPEIEAPESEPITAWDRNMRDYLKGERTSLVNMWIFHNRKQYKAGKLSSEKHEKLLKINFPFEANPKK